MAKVEIRPFKLESPNCFYCGAKLTLDEAKYSSTIKYYDKDKKEMGRIECYVCFACVERFTGKRIKHK